MGLSDEDDASGCPSEKREETDYMAALAPMHLRFQGHTSLSLSLSSLCTPVGWDNGASATSNFPFKFSFSLQVHLITFLRAKMLLQGLIVKFTPAIKS